MKIGCVKEIKNHEYRVGLTPACVIEYTKAGHQVLIEKNAGDGAGFSDLDYQKAGAKICDKASDVWNNVEMLIKVKEPLKEEFQYFRPNLILYTYLHLADNEELTKALMKSGVKAIAYETIQEADRSLPALKPMSEIAGRLSIQEGAKYLEKPFGGKGILLGGVPGVQRGKVAIIGAGVVGMNAAHIAIGLGAQVAILDRNIARLQYIDDIFHSRITTLYSNEANIKLICKEADLIIGSVLIPGAKAPKLIRHEHIPLIKKGTVLVDVAIDQGGCFEMSRPTSHDNPTFEIDGIIMYCVGNMPGVVSKTSTEALTNATLGYGLLIADHGVEKACLMNQAISKGLNVYNHKITFAGVANSLKLEYTPIEELIK